MTTSNYETIKIKTRNMSLIWKESRGIAPDSVADKMDGAMLCWMSELTDALSIWIERGLEMTEGELILAYANIGALVEAWLKLFYCAYYEDYIDSPKMRKNKTPIEPNDMTFEALKEYSVQKLWKDRNDPFYLWVGQIQYRRNAIHAFNYRDIGSAFDLLASISTFCDFVELILERLPSMEDYIERYPSGYIMIP